MMSLLKFSSSLDVFFVVIGIRDLLEIAADHGGWFVVLGYCYRIESALAVGNENVASHEIHEVRTLQKQLRHPRIVVVGARHVAIRAALGFFAANRMWHKRGKSLPAEAFRRNRLLLV